MFEVLIHLSNLESLSATCEENEWPLSPYPLYVTEVYIAEDVGTLYNHLKELFLSQQPETLYSKRTAIKHIKTRIKIFFLLYYLFISIIPALVTPINNPNPKITLYLYPNPPNLLPTRHLSSLSLRRTKLQPLVLPSLRTKLVQRPLALAVGSGAVFPATAARVRCLDETCVVAVEQVAFEIVLVLFFGEGVGAIFGVGPAGSCKLLGAVCLVMGVGGTYPGTESYPPSPR